MSRKTTMFYGRPEFYRLIEYPFVLEEERIASLWLPREGLTQEEADRLSAYVQTLVARPRIAASSGGTENT